MPKSEGKRDIPADVERYVKEHKDQGADESYAWALAWSRYCEYKNPGSDHCKQDVYFPGRKNASEELSKVLPKLSNDQILALWNGISSGKVDPKVFSAFAKEFTRRNMKTLSKKASAKNVVRKFLGGKLYFGERDMKVGEIYLSRWGGDLWYFQPMSPMSKSGKIKGLLYIDGDKKAKKVFIGRNTNFEGMEWETTQDLPDSVLGMFD